MQKVVGSNPIIRFSSSPPFLLSPSARKAPLGRGLSARHAPGDSVSSLRVLQQRRAGGGARAARLRGFHRKVLLVSSDEEHRERPRRSVKPSPLPRTCC